MAKVKAKLSDALGSRLIDDALNHVVMLSNIAVVTQDSALQEKCHLWMRRCEAWAKQIKREQRN
jgi:hypothetical protein